MGGLFYERIVNPVVIQPLGKRSTVGFGMLPDPSHIRPTNRAGVADFVISNALQKVGVIGRA
ncbi:MAG: hypothetical protein ABI785_08485 [Gemmatimonadales bacterium]